ncbi:MAG TPA: hypothetical protein VIN10_06635 [Bacteroidales bacterium]
MEYLNLWEYAFRMNEETSWMIKFDIGAYDNFQVSFEKRIARSFSLNLGAGPSSYDEPTHAIYILRLNTFLESRWYYRQNKRIGTNDVARNMSDNYFALGLSYTYLPNEPNTEYVTLYSKWGLQRRFLTVGHVDMGVKLGIGNDFSESFSPFFTFSTFVDIGMAYTKEKFKLDFEKLCPVLKCYEADKFIVKSNLSSLFSVALYKYEKSVNIAPQISFERKIGQSPFSINTGIQTVFRYLNSFQNKDYQQEYKYEGSSIIVNYLLEGRYYYNLKRRILTGKSGNGLSANYLALGGDLEYYTTYYNTDKSYNSNYFDQEIYFATGWQRLFGKHLYYDINIGIGYQFATSFTNGEFNPRSGIAVGYRF